MKHTIASLVFSCLFLYCCPALFAQTGAQAGGYTPPESDPVKVRFVSNETLGTAWGPKPKPDWAKYTEGQQGGGSAPAADPKTPEADWQKYMPKDPVCETTPPKKKGGDKIDVWTVEGWSPIEFVFTAKDGELPVTTKFTIFPNNKEVQLESSASIGSLWTLKASDGVTPVEKPFAQDDKKKDKKKEKKADAEKAEPVAGKPQVVSWSLAEMTKPTATADFVFNYRGKELTTVTVTIVKKEPAAKK